MTFFSRIALVLALAATGIVSSVPASAAVLDREVEVIGGFETQEFTLVLEAGRSYRIVVDGDGDSDLDAYLYDENGHLISKDDDLTDLSILRVTPRWTGPFTVRVVNRGRASNLFTISLHR
jgi:hypothetical protein